MINKDMVETLLDDFNLGASTAENDPLLEGAKIETQEFSDLYKHDRIDIVRGIKGAGKTALYRVFYFLRDYMAEKKKLFTVFGVEATGDPIFKLFHKEFETYNETEFENFWGVYFIVLVYKLVFNVEGLRHQIRDEVTQIDELLLKMGIKIDKNGFALKDIQWSILDCFKKNKIKVGMETKIDPMTALPASVTPAIEITPTNIKGVSESPIYLADFRNLIVSILQKHNLKIWIMLDRLDEVFVHRSQVERNGLRGLLRAAYNFSQPFLRVKIFLREDIIDYLSSSGFTALTHVTDRCSSTMSWSKDNMMHLITKRISALERLRAYYKISDEQIDRDKNYREKVFYDIFPLRIGKTTTFDWLFSNCADGNNVVTPRDMIDFFKFAKAEQFKKFKLNPQDQDFLITTDTLKKALEELSRHKKTTFLFAEFPHLKEEISKFEGGCSDHNAESLKSILGNDWAKIIDELKSIGFIKYIPKKALYKIPVIWRKGLNIKRAKAFK